MKKSFWLSYDLGIKGDYVSLYTWLVNLDAVECCDNVAYFRLESDSKDPVKLVAEDLAKNVPLSITDRIYLIWREGTSVRGRFLFGGRKPAPWAGYGYIETATEEST